MADYTTNLLLPYQKNDQPRKAGIFNYAMDILEAALSLRPSLIFTTNTADNPGSNATGAQSLFAAAVDTLTVDASSTYAFDGHFVMTRAAGVVSHTTTIQFGGTATVASIMWTATVSNPTTNILAAAQDIHSTAASAVVTAAVVAATEILRVRVTGIVRFSAAGTFIPQYALSAAPGGAFTVLRNSYFTARKLGADTVASQGSWA